MSTKNQKINTEGDDNKCESLFIHMYVCVCLVCVLCLYDAVARLYICLLFCKHCRHLLIVMKGEWDGLLRLFGYQIYQHFFYCKDSASIALHSSSKSPHIRTRSQRFFLLFSCLYTLCLGSVPFLVHFLYLPHKVGFGRAIITLR